MTTVQTEVRLPNGEYIERHEDLSVKVLGGAVSLARTWSNGRWYLNPAWASLRFVRDPLDGSVKVVDRAGSLYIRQGDLYVFDGILGSRRFLQQTANGWRWRDDTGNWIDYDSAGRPTAYGDRNDAIVRFVLDGEGRRAEVRDHNDQLVVGFTYQDGRLTEARDRSGRIVRYAYEGDRLATVTDAAGQVWRYEYDAQGQLIGRTDPLGGKCKSSTSFRHRQGRSRWMVTGRAPPKPKPASNRPVCRNATSRSHASARSPTKRAA